MIQVARHPIIGIHRRTGFFERWLKRCESLGIEARIVDGYITNIIEELKECHALLWHLSQDSMRELEFARSILFAAERMGIHVYPNINTAFHFDNKISQKYLLEAIDAPLAPSWVFFSKSDALDWAKMTTFPKVFKLRRGAGSANVRLVTSSEEAVRLIKIMFGRGMSPLLSAGAKLKRGVAKNKGKKPVISLLRSLPHYVRAHLKAKAGFGREREYVYFQEFIPDAQFDTRITIIGNRAFFFRRRVRPDDFRASGSGLIEYPVPDDRDLDTIRIAFNIADRLHFQSMAFDFVSDRNAGNTYLVEMSYVFNADAVNACPGHFDSELNWHEGRMWPQDAILNDILRALHVG